jgi:hypothetical protein
VLATVARVRGVARVKVVVVVGVVSHKGIRSEVGSSVMMFLRQVKEVCVLQFQDRKRRATIRKVIDIVFQPASNRSMTPFLDLEMRLEAR